jgi:hypothetical protein
MSVTDYQSTLHNIPEESRPHWRRSWSLKLWLWNTHCWILNFISLVYILLTRPVVRSPGLENVFVPLWPVKDNIFNYLNLKKIRLSSRSRFVTGTKSVWRSTQSVEPHAARGPLFTHPYLWIGLYNMLEGLPTPNTSSQGGWFCFPW